MPKRKTPAKPKAQKGKKLKQDDGPKSKYFAKDDKVSKKPVAVATPCTSKTTSDGDAPPTSRVPSSFFNKDCQTLAKDLLGTKLVRKLGNGDHCWGSIVETEAYLGGEDKAAHSYNGKKTDKNRAMYMDPGTVYVYHIYGLYTCINISSQGEGAAVLIRAVDIEGGKDNARKRRSVKKKPGSKELKDKELGNGPSKLTQALQIDKASFNTVDINTCPDLWLSPGSVDQTTEMVVGSRIGVDYAAEWAKKPLRYYVKGNQSASVRDKEGEERLQKGEKVEAVKLKARSN